MKLLAGGPLETSRSVVFRNDLITEWFEVVLDERTKFPVVVDHQDTQCSCRSATCASVLSRKRHASRNPAHHNCLMDGRPQI